MRPGKKSNVSTKKPPVRFTNGLTGVLQPGIMPSERMRPSTSSAPTMRFSAAMRLLSVYIWWGMHISGENMADSATSLMISSAVNPLGVRIQ